MKFEKLSEQDLKNLFPNNGTLSLKKMTKKLKERYLLLYFSYRKLFTEYIIKKANLIKYDAEISSSELTFKPIDTEDMDIYQYFSSNILKYFYIRNNVYIEKLTNEERERLCQNIENENCKLTPDIEKMIKNTFEKVIFEDVCKDEKNYIVSYGPNSKHFGAKNNSLVIGMRYDEFYEDGLDDESWELLNNERVSYLYTFFNNMIQNIKSEFDIPITILQYNEFSVISRKQATQNKNEEER